jgi:hypothetical protein
MNLCMSIPWVWYWIHVVSLVRQLPCPRIITGKWLNPLENYYLPLRQYGGLFQGVSWKYAQNPTLLQILNAFVLQVVSQNSGWSLSLASRMRKVSATTISFYTQQILIIFPLSSFSIVTLFLQTYLLKEGGSYSYTSVSLFTFSFSEFCIYICPLIIKTEFRTSDSH